MNTFTYSLPESLTFDNHLAIEKDILDKIGKDSYDEIVLDAENTRYISSAGLRIILSLKKKYPNTSVINTSIEVYDIFQMTGFTNIIKVEKSLRRVSVDGCPIIGKGAHGTVYSLAPDTIVKVYEKGALLDEIQTERELSKKAFVLGLPTAIALDIVKVEDKYGIVFELLNAHNCVSYVKKDQKHLDDYIDKAADLLKLIHNVHIEDGSLPDIKQKTLKYVDSIKKYLTDEVYQDVLKVINDIEDTKTLVHADFHLKNQLMCGDDLMLIDMDTLCIGHPLFDMASICNAYYEYSMISEETVTSFLDLPIETCHYIWHELSRRYWSDLDDKQYQLMANKARLIGSVRAVHFFDKRGYDQSYIDKGARDICEALAAIK